MAYILRKMSSEESQKLIAALKEWADAEYGRRAELARMLGVSRQLVSDWFAGRKTPTLDSGLKIQAFLKKQHRKSPRA
jgi:hypothetical protein